MRLRYLPMLFIPVFTFLAIYVSGEKGTDNFEANREMIVLRKIGHELLLNAGDSHSRVLPVQKISGHEFKLSFENPIALSPDSVVHIINTIAKDNKLAAYSVNIRDCRKNEVVYAFAMSDPITNQGLVPCSGRPLPKDCYSISLLFPGRDNSGWPAWYYYIGGALVTAFSFLLWIKSRRRKKPTADHDPVVPQTGVHIGRYIFHTEQQYLDFAGNKITLTYKEARLLAILSATPNTVIERSQLQKEVWENEGVIVTRSLDMFMSKLRKKLSDDSNVKIVNVHGKGYKLEING